MMKLVFLLLSLLVISFAAVVSDEVHNMPQFPSDMNFTMYSGLLSLPNTTEKQIHYVFLTKAGELSTNNDAPVILWLNGGPGCSSLDGLMFENGPYVLEDGQKELNGTFNIWGWNQFANILYFESPAGVGFSPVSANGTTYDDPTTTKDNYDALVSFFEGFPELLANDFWISGESYAGVYVPWLGAYIAEQNQLSQALFINLQGIMVGNGVASYENNLFTEMDFFYGHYMIPDDLYSQVYQQCEQDQSKPECKKVLDQVNELTALVNPYDIYRYCYTGDNAAGNKQGWLYNQWLSHLTYSLRKSGVLPENNLKGTDVPCLYTAGVNTYLNIPEVKEALHVSQDINFVFCNTDVNTKYNVNPKASLEKYKELIAQKYKILVYSGDTDASVPYTGTLNWIEGLNLGVKEDWRPWYLGDQVMGFVEVYEGLTFATVKGVGHQVPAWKRQEGYVLINTFVNDQDLPRKMKKEKKVKEDMLIEL